MSAKDRMSMRLNYYGGKPQESRMNRDKAWTLSKALLYSYQAQTAVLADGREFRCLINVDKLKGDYDNKTISIPFEDVCLNKPRIGKRSEGIEVIGMTPGNVFTWKETNTHWLVYLRYLEENAYFRADIRRCDQEVEINGKRYWTYIRGPVETSIVWNQKAQVEWNDLNYSLVMYITKDENTLEFFHRFAKCKIADDQGNEKTWQVVNANSYFGDGIIEVYLDEYYENSILDAVEQEKIDNPKYEEEVPVYGPYIEGPLEIKPYQQYEYTICNFDEKGTWVCIIGDKTYILAEDKFTIPFELANTKVKSFTLKYLVNYEEIASQKVNVISV